MINCLNGKDSIQTSKSGVIQGGTLRGTKFSKNIIDLTLACCTFIKIPASMQDRQILLKNKVKE